MEPTGVIRNYDYSHLFFDKDGKRNFKKGKNKMKAQGKETYIREIFSQ